MRYRTLILSPSIYLFSSIDRKIPETAMHRIDWGAFVSYKDDRKRLETIPFTDYTSNGISGYIITSRLNYSLASFKYAEDYAYKEANKLLSMISHD